MLTPDEARGIALLGHLHQKEKDGAPYIHHLDRVAALVPRRLRVAAYLHDIMEDCGLDIPELGQLGVEIPDAMVIYTVTRRPFQKTYADFINHIIDSRLADAICVKTADVLDHLRPGYELVLDDRQILKYHTALDDLTDALRDLT